MELNQKYKNKEWLYNHYMLKRMSTYQISKMVNRDNKTIYYYFKKFKIKTRKRGENLSKNGCDNYMKNHKNSPMLGRKHSEQTKKFIGIKSSIPKPSLRGKNNGMYGKKGKLNPNYKDGSSAERQCIYASSEWKELIRKVFKRKVFKRKVFKRDNYLCQRCINKHKYRNPLHVHHLKSWASNPDKIIQIKDLKLQI